MVRHLEEIKKMVLTYKQFVKKHQQKYSGLSDAEKQRRYQSYKNSVSMPRNKIVINKNSNRKNNKMVVKNKGSQTIMQYNKKNQLQIAWRSLSSCSAEYAKALIDPWCVTIPPCVPDTIVLPSFKYSTRGRGNFVIGTAGVGYIAMLPINGATSDRGCVAYTNATYAATTITNTPPHHN
jgi:hypothetical protein